MGHQSLSTFSIFKARKTSLKFKFQQTSKRIKNYNALALNFTCTSVLLNTFCKNIFFSLNFSLYDLTYITSVFISITLKLTIVFRTKKENLIKKWSTSKNIMITLSEIFCPKIFTIVILTEITANLIYIFF